MSKPVIQVKESDVQKCILDWLSAERIWHIRLNTGAMAGSHKGKKWFVRFGRPGMADILAAPIAERNFVGEGVFHTIEFPLFVWIEVKGPNGVQSDEQKRFQSEITEAGMHYVLARSLEDVMKVMK